MADILHFSRGRVAGWEKGLTSLIYPLLAAKIAGKGTLADRPRATKTPSKLSEVTRRTIVMLKQAHPEWGCQRVSDELVRGPALAASSTAVARVLHEAGYQLEERVTHPHPDKMRRFERARPNQLWQTDLFTFVLKRQSRRLYLVGFMDDHSRFVAGYGLHASASGALVLEVLRSAIASYGPPEEIRAVCSSPARTDLCGGRRATGASTAISLSVFQNRPSH